MAEQDLAGRRALITGGGSGIGLACAHEFASRGAHVTIADLNAGAATDAATAVGGESWVIDLADTRALDVLTLSADGSKIDQVTSFIARSGESLTPEELANFPDEAVEEAKVVSIFTRVGLPDRLD